MKQPKEEMTEYGNMTANGKQNNKKNEPIVFCQIEAYDV